METLLSFLSVLIAAAALDLGDSESATVHGSIVDAGSKDILIGLNKAKRISGQPPAQYSSCRFNGRYFFPGIGRSLGIPGWILIIFRS